MFLWIGRTLGQNEVYLLLPGLTVVGLELVGHRHVVLRSPELVVELGVVQGQGDERSELGDHLLIILYQYLITIGLIMYFLNLCKCSSSIVLIDELYHTNQCSSDYYRETEDGMCGVASLKHEIFSLNLSNIFHV